MQLPKLNNLVLDHRYWKGDFRDYSGNGNDGTPTGVHFEKQPDKHASFDGSDVITVLDSSELQLTEGTIIVYGDFDDYASDYRRLVSKREGGGTNYDFYLKDSTSIGLYTDSQETANIGWQGAKSIGMSFEDGKKAKGYKDGVFITDFTDTSDIAVDGSDMYIGNFYSASASYVMNNPLKGVLIYNTVLTDEEIAQAHEWIMENTKTPSKPKKNFAYPSRITGDEDGLVAAYDMKNVHGKIIDKTGNGYDGTNYFCSQTKINGLDALKFNGSTSYIDVGDNVDIGAGDFSISFLVKPESISTQQFLSKGAGNGTQEGYFMRMDGSGNLETFISDGSSFVLEDFRSTDSLSEGQIYHVVLSLDRDGNAQYYINGVADNSEDISSWSATDITGTTDLYLGKITFGGTQFLDASMADLRFYSKALTQAEVSALYNKYAKLPVFVDDCSDYNESIAAESGTYLSDSPYQIISGTWKISRRTDQPNGKQIECVTDGQLKYSGLVNADDMYTKEFELVSGTPTLTKNSTNIEIDAVAGEKVGKVHLTFGTC